ncbi:MAG: hypothetical protein ACKVE4_07225 [Dissulfuribacterales bacterium]
MTAFTAVKLKVEGDLGLLTKATKFFKKYTPPPGEEEEQGEELIVKKQPEALWILTISVLWIRSSLKWAFPMMNWKSACPRHFPRPSLKVMFTCSPEFQGTSIPCT